MMKLYEVIFDENKDKGIYALSVVETPAMEGLFVALNEDQKPEPTEIKLEKVDGDQRILMGVALIPNKPIYRNQNGEEFYIQFSEDTIKKAAHSFLKNQFNNNSSIEHEVALSGMSVVESWIIEDPKQDKSAKYGFDYPAGSWMVSMKVDNDEVWNEYVKTGKIKGFSIDGLFSLKEITLKQEEMNETSKITEAIEKGFLTLKELFTRKESTKVTLATAMLADGETQVEYEGELAEGTALFVVVPDGDNVPAPDGSHELEDGTVVMTEGGLVTSIEPAAEAPAEESSEEEAVEMSEPVEMNSEVKQVTAWSMMVKNNMFVVGDVVERVWMDGQLERSEPVGAGEFMLEDGRFVVTDAEGKIVVIKPAAEEPAEEPAQEEAPAEEEVEAAVEMSADEKLAQFEAQLSERFNSMKAEFSAQMEEKDNKIAELEAQLASTPASKPKKHTPADVQLSEPKNRKERMQNILKSIK